VATGFFDTASAQPAGLPMPAKKLGVRPEVVVNRIWALLQKPHRGAYVPRLFVLVPWVELCLGWLMDLLGPLLLRRQLRLNHVSAEV